MRKIAWQRTASLRHKSKLLRRAWFLKTTRNCAEIEFISVVFTIVFFHRSSRRSLTVKWGKSNNKNYHTFWRVRAKIMKQSKQVPNKLPKRKEAGWIFFGYSTQSWHGFTCTRCSSVFQHAGPNVQIEIGCHVNGVESLSCLSVVSTIPSTTSKPRTTAFCALRLTNYDGEF